MFCARLLIKHFIGYCVHRYDPAEGAVTMCTLPHGHGAPDVRGAGETEYGTRFGKEAGGVSCVVPVTHNHTFLITRHHQVVIHRRPVQRCHRGL